MSAVRVTVNVDVSGIVNGFETVIHDNAFNLSMYDALARYCNPYVPYLNGPLSETVEITPKCVRYIQPYARRQYYGDNFNFTRDYHPLVTSRWDEAMMRDHGEEFFSEVKELMAKRLNELNE